MPRKVRQLIADLQRAGFINRGGKGSHRRLAAKALAAGESLNSYCVKALVKA